MMNRQGQEPGRDGSTERCAHLAMAPGPRSIHNEGMMKGYREVGSCLRPSARMVVFFSPMTCVWETGSHAFMRTHTHT